MARIRIRFLKKRKLYFAERPARRSRRVGKGAPTCRDGRAMSLSNVLQNHMTPTSDIGLILLPGMDGTGELLKPLAERLSAHRPVCIMAYPIDRHLDYVELTDFVGERLPGDRFVILGESFSGPIAVAIAATNPDAAGLILASSFVRHPLPQWMSALTWLLDVRWMPSTVIAAALMGSGATPELARTLRCVLRELPPSLLRARARDALRIDERLRLGETTCAMLCLHGSADRLIGRDEINDIVAARPDCELHRLDAPHMLLATLADAAAAIIDDFCNRLARN
ncbi:alpha/beta fold hydrolase [Bradyrhizobium sp. HKCCYLS2038]|uniref:alpha/beta fold hydrolase n=1 Tax=unclassified Bradyrhizobium TaxID=2631580 RepID=UPI003EBA600E